VSQNQQETSQRKPGWPELLVILTSTAAQCWIIWLSLPPQQRYWIRLRVMGKARQLAGRRAWLEGHAGMGEELQTGRKSVRYLTAWGLGLMRELAQGELDRMKP